MFIDDSFFERDDGVVGDGDVFGADFGAAFGDVAIADAELVFQFVDSIFGIERVHLERRRIDEKSRPDELFVLHVVAKDVANILAEITLDALAKFLNAVDVGLLHPPRAVCGIRRPRLELLDALLDLVVPRDVADQILDRREGAHRFDGDRFGNVDRVKPRHAHQLWLAVDLGRTRSALAGLTVPTAGEIRSRFGLDLVHRIKHDHALGYLGPIVDHLPALASASANCECC